MKKLFTIWLCLFFITPAFCQIQQNVVDIQGYNKVRNIADSLVTAVDWNGAIQAHTLALQCKPNDSVSLLVRGISYMAIKENLKAYQDFNQLIVLNENNTHAYFMRGMIILNLNSEGVDEKKYSKHSACSDFKKAKQLGYRINDEYLYAQACPGL